MNLRGLNSKHSAGVHLELSRYIFSSFPRLHNAGTLPSKELSVLVFLQCVEVQAVIELSTRIDVSKCLKF